MVRRSVEVARRFRRRSGRGECWFFVLFSATMPVVLSTIDGVIGILDSATGLGLLGDISSLAILIPSIAASVRRLHDIDRTGRWLLITFVPPIGTAVLFAVQYGTPGSNLYGPRPKTATA